jgi:hypothetical protein
VPSASAVFLYAPPSSPSTADADKALRALVPTLRAAGIRVPYLADLPTGCLVGVAEVVGVVRDGDGWALDLGAVQPLPFALDVEPTRASFFTIAPGEQAWVEAWGQILESTARTIDDAAALLTSAGFDPDAAREIAAVAVPAIVRAESMEAAAKLQRKAEALVAKHRPSHAPRKTSHAPIARVA